MTGSEPTRVLVLDDHEIVRSGLSDLLQADGEFDVVATTGTVTEALPLLRGLRPDIAVIDVQLPDGSGIDLVRQLKEDLSEIATVVLTSFDDDALLIDALEAGAEAFMVKEIRSFDLTKTLRRIAAGQPIYSDDERVKVIAQARIRLSARDGTADLSPQELRIFERFGDGLTNRQIGEKLFIAEKTVKNYITSLFSKLGVNRRAEAAAMAARRAERSRRTPD